MKQNHLNLAVGETGFFVNPKWPHIGASPDGLVTCNCCPKSILEIKCPYNCANSVTTSKSGDTIECQFLKKINGKINLDEDHQYYYQVQTQLAVVDVPFAYFVVWSEENCTNLKIERNHSFFDNCISSVQHFYKYGILPELIGKWYTRSVVADTHGIVRQHDLYKTSDATQSDQNVDPHEPQCYCGEPSLGDMILCSNSRCGIKHYHRVCLKISIAPRGKWICPSCSRLPSIKKQCSQKRK